MTEFERKLKTLWTSMRSAEDDAGDIKELINALLLELPSLPPLNLTAAEKKGLKLVQDKWLDLKPVLDRITELWDNLNASLNQKETL